MSTTTIQQYRTQLHVELDRARRGARLDLSSPGAPHPSADPVLRAESKVPLIFRRIDAAGHSKALELTEEIERRLMAFDPERLDPYLRWARYNIHTVLLTGLGRLREAEIKLDIALSIARDNGNQQWLDASLTNLAKLQIRTNRPLDASKTLASLIRHADSETTRTLAYSHLGDLVQLHGQSAQGLRYRRIAVDRLAKATPLMQVWVLAPYILNLIELSEYSEASASLSDARLASAKANSALYSSVLDHIEAVLLLAKGQPDKALVLLDPANDPANDPATASLAATGHLVSNLCVPHLEAEVLAARNHPIGALARIDVALDATTLPLDEVRLCTLAIKISKSRNDWERTTAYQNRMFHAIQRRHGTSHNLLKLHVQSERAAQIRETNDRLSKINSDLQASRAARDDVLDIVSHDVMTPLTILRLLLHSYGEHPPEEALLGICDGIDAALGRLETIIPELAVWGEIQQQGEPSVSGEAEWSDIEDVAKEVVSAHLWSASQKGITCSISVDQNASLEVLGNRSKIAHILENLVSNAIKFSSDKQHVHLNVRPLAGSGSERTVVDVVDSGPGLTESDLERLFSRYGQVSARPTAGESSTGLGLYIAKQLASSIDADLWAESAGRGRGSQFHLVLRAERKRE